MFEILEPFLGVFFMFSFVFGVVFAEPFGLTLDVPLRSEHGFDDVLGSGADTDLHGVGSFPFEELEFFEVFDDLDSAIESFHSLVFSSVLVDSTIVVEDVNLFESVSETTEVIVRVVSGGDLDGSGTEVHIDEFVIDNDLQDSVGDEWVDKFLANKILVSFVLGVNGDSSISEHGFNSGSGYSQSLGWIRFKLVLKMYQDSEFVPALMSWDLDLLWLRKFEVIDFNI